MAQLTEPERKGHKGEMEREGCGLQAGVAASGPAAPTTESSGCESDLEKPDPGSPAAV